MNILVMTDNFWIHPKRCPVVLRRTLYLGVEEHSGGIGRHVDTYQHFTEVSINTHNFTPYLEV